ncbi:hypothetical protein F3Y22_tig00112738pilonHSYRG00878 [Hibiscus syriacus]|uniref:RNase H type-1 domain-containing protein n=1 Tax=Hibiscus syriacus TaxID=106335 RepID=A0A6A2WUY8_HIBSY|nr:hypothetical protein F3Y22_tig00112738pilonHSYRG00878 [Hibiscus syriacus]
MGHRMLWFTKKIEFCNIVEADLWGDIVGLQSTWRLGIRQIQVEIDNNGAVKLILEKSSSGKSLTILQHMDAMLACEWNVQLKHILRDSNRVADVLVEHVWKLPVGLHEFTQHPAEIVRKIRSGDPELG